VVVVVTMAVTNVDLKAAHFTRTALDDLVADLFKEACLQVKAITTVVIVKTMEDKKPQC
jgi:hypothetical protein